MIKSILLQVRAAGWLLGRALPGILFASPVKRYERAICWHHDSKNGTSWIRSALVDLGRNKLWWCSACGEMWFIGEYLRGIPRPDPSDKA
jgi:hypothetical protein